MVFGLGRRLDRLWGNWEFPRPEGDISLNPNLILTLFLRRVFLIFMVFFFFFFLSLHKRVSEKGWATNCWSKSRFHPIKRRSTNADFRFVSWVLIFLKLRPLKCIDVLANRRLSYLLCVIWFHLKSYIRKRPL